MGKDAKTIRKALKNPNISKKRKAALRAILKTGSRKAGGKVLRLIPIPIIGTIIDELIFPAELNADEDIPPDFDFGPSLGSCPLN